MYNGRMNTKTSPPSVSSFLPAAILLFLLGWGGWLAVFFLTPPSGGTRWLFFFCGMLGLTGAALPFAAFLNRRFPSTPPPTSGVIFRQATWVGVYVATLVWLQFGRVLTLAQALLLALGLALVEWLLRLREKSRWSPETTPKA